MSRFNVYRNGKMHVCAKMCETCIYRKDSPLFDVRIKSEAKRSDTAVICHSTLKADQKLVCAGFYAHDKTPTLQLAERMGIVVKVQPPSH